MRKQSKIHIYVNGLPTVEELRSSIRASRLRKEVNKMDPEKYDELEREQSKKMKSRGLDRFLEKTLE